MMRALNRLPSTLFAFGAVLLVLGFCGILYWKHVETQSLHLQERNFRVLTVTGRALGAMVAKYGIVFKSVIEGDPPCSMKGGPSCSDKVTRNKAYKDAIEALPSLKNVMVTEAMGDLDGLAVKFATQNGVSVVKLTYVHQDRAMLIQTKWKVQAVLDIRTIMRQLVTEDIFSDVLLANPTGRVLYHHQSTRDPSGFEFEDVSAFLHRRNDSESKDGGDKKEGAAREEDLVSKLPLFNEDSIGGIPHTIFAQAMNMQADQGTEQTLILVGIVPAGQFQAEARAIPLNYLLLMAGVLLLLFFVLPYLKLRTNLPTERLTPISVVVLILSAILGTAALTFCFADVATYRNLEHHLDMRLRDVSEEIRKQFHDDVQRGLAQLAMFDQACKGECLNRLHGSGGPHLAQRLCVEIDDKTEKNEFFFFQTDSGQCFENNDQNNVTRVVYPDVKTMFWVESTGELKVLRSREQGPWKYANLKERKYVRRILEDETLIRKHDGKKFWIEPIFSRTTGENAAVFSMKSWTFSEGRNPDGRIVAALEVKLPSVTDVGVPPGMGFAVIDQEGNVLFHSDPRRNLRENLFEETDRDGRLRQAIFTRAAAQFDGRYWGKDRHFHIAPLFEPIEIRESPDVHWSLVTYWDTDILQVLNLRALYSSGALFFIYAFISLSIGILGWWIYSRVTEETYGQMWPQSEHLYRHQIVLGLFVVSLVAVGIWYVRPHSYPDMLLWGLLPALVGTAVVWSITQTDADSTDHNKIDLSARPRYPRAYALLVTVGLLTFVVIPALVIFRVAVDVEWRLLAKFALFDLEQDRKLQAQKVRQSYLSSFFHDTNRKGDVRTAFFEKFPDQTRVYADFPFKRCGQDSEERTSCQEASTNVSMRGDERLIRWLYYIIDRPRIGHSGTETDMFLEEPEPWHESERGTLGLIDRSRGTTSPISLHSIPSPIPPWLYSMLVFGGLAPLVALRVKKAAAVGVLGGFLLFGLNGEVLVVLVVLGASALLYGAYYVLPRFAAQRVLLLDFPYPSSHSCPPHNAQGENDSNERPPSWSAGLWDAFVKEMSALRNALCLIDIQWSAELTEFCEKILKRDIGDDLDVGKETIIREILEDEKISQYYMQMWEKRTESQRRSLFNLARDGFLHSRNPDIWPLLKHGLIVADRTLRPMNESFRRFIIRAGGKDRLDEDVAQTRSGTWFQVWRPIGVGLVLIMVFLVLTQEQYRAITLAFLGVLPALLGAFSQVLTSSKKEKGDTAPSA